MTSVNISPSIGSPLCFYKAADKANVELLAEFIKSKKGAAELSSYFECVGKSDGRTPLLCAVKRRDAITVELLGKAGAKLLVASAESALRIAMLDTTPDQEMLVLLLNLGANPYIPDRKGQTDMEYALARKAMQFGHYKTADRFGDCLRSFVKAKSAFSATVQMLFPSGRIISKPYVWEDRECALIPRYNQQGIVTDMQLVIFSKPSRGADVTVLWVTDAEVSLQQVPYAKGVAPSSSIGLLLPIQQHCKPEKLVSVPLVGSKHSGWTIFIGCSHRPLLKYFIDQAKLPGNPLTPQPGTPQQLQPGSPPTAPPSPLPTEIQTPFPPPTSPTKSYTDLLEPLPPYTPPPDLHRGSGSDLSRTASFPSHQVDEEQQQQAAFSVPDTGALQPPAAAMGRRLVSLPHPTHQLYMYICVSGDCHQLASQCSALGVQYELIAEDTVMLTGPESALPQAVDQLHASCSRFQQGCVQQALPLEGYRVAAFTHPDTRARSSQLLEQQAQDVGLRHRVRISLELNQVGGPSNAALHGAEIQVVKGSLTQQAVTAIVNPTNGTLGVNGGVSNHIAGKLEPGELEKQCKAAIKELPAGQHCVPVGGTAVTECSKAGRKKLQCRYIIHAVGPHGNQQTWTSLLASTVRSVLTSAADKGMESVAMPLIGAGLAGWPKHLVAQVCLDEVSSFLRAAPSSLKVVRFVDQNDEAIAALQAVRLTFLGHPNNCASAMQDMQQHIEGTMVSITIRLSNFLIRQERQAMLQNPALSFVHCQLIGDCLMIKGCQELVTRARQFVLERITEVIDLELGHPPDWAHMGDANTQLFEVDLKEPAVAGLVSSLQARGATVVKVHRIQNKLLWAAYAGNRFAMKGRWRHEPNLAHINGGGPILWHGTGGTDPWVIYAAEHGFMSHHAKLDGLWGCGTYYSTLPRLAMDYQHSVGSADMGMRNGLHSFDSCEGLKQMLAVDVLTGKAKELAEDRSLRIAPEIEGTHGDIAGRRYDSVYGVHPFERTPIYITYNSGHAYPKFLITYRR